MISRTAEYAVRAALWLAAYATQPCTVRQIARGTAVPAGYLAKVLQLLGRAGIVRAQPGPGGGFLLARPPEELVVLQVIEAVDPVPRIQACPLNVDAHAHCLCPLHARLDSALAAIQQNLGACTFAQLLAESDSRGLFCRTSDSQSSAPPRVPPQPISGKRRRAAPAAATDRSGPGPGAGKGITP